MTTMNLSLSRRALVLGTIALSLHSGAAFAQDKVRLAINLSPISALPLIAQNKGLFQKQGLEVTIANFTSGRQAL